jgi:hypothetical protein
MKIVSEPAIAKECHPRPPPLYQIVSIAVHTAKSPPIDAADLEPLSPEVMVIQVEQIAKRRDTRPTQRIATLDAPVDMNAMNLARHFTGLVCINRDDVRGPPWPLTRWLQRNSNAASLSHMWFNIQSRLISTYVKRGSSVTIDCRAWSVG